MGLFNGRSEFFFKFLLELRAWGVKSLTSYLQRFPTHIGIDTLISSNINKFIRFILGQIFNIYGMYTHYTVVFYDFTINTNINFSVPWAFSVQAQITRGNNSSVTWTCYACQQINNYHIIHAYGCNLRGKRKPVWHN